MKSNFTSLLPKKYIMNKGFLLSCIVFFIFSCSGKEEEKINFELIPEQTMASILFDIHMHDGIINAYNNQDKANIFLSKEHYSTQILQKYNCTDTLFKMNIQHYTVNGKIKDIYSLVLDSMNAIKGKLDQQKQKRTPTSRFSKRYLKEQK